MFAVAFGAQLCFPLSVESLGALSCLTTDLNQKLDQTSHVFVNAVVSGGAQGSDASLGIDIDRRIVRGSDVSTRFDRLCFREDEISSTVAMG